LEKHQWRVFWIVTTAGFFDYYDRALLTLALKQIQRGLGIAEASLGRMLSLVRLGYFFALLITPLADRFGRRTMLLYTIVGYTIATALTAVAPGERTFVACQVAARGFAAAEAAVGVVILAEVVGAELRGWSIGLWGALTVSGWGLAALVFAFVDVIPFGWRGLFAVAIIPLVVIIPLRRALPETERFKEHNARASRGSTVGSVFKPLAQLFSVYPRRAMMLFGVQFLAGLGSNSSGFFTSKYLQEAHGWSPGEVSSLVVLGGAIGILGNVVAGRLSDRYGRRSMGSIFLFFAGLLMLIFFNSAGPIMIGAWIACLFFDSASTTILNAFGTELFPTGFRSTASSALTVSGTTGGALGLFVESVLFRATGSHWLAISYLTAFWMLAPLIMAMTFPETAGRELETISPEPENQLERAAN
jgi:putative MFS transporter